MVADTPEGAGAEERAEDDEVVCEHGRAPSREAMEPCCTKRTGTSTHFVQLGAGQLAHLRETGKTIFLKIFEQCFVFFLGQPAP